MDSSRTAIWARFLAFVAASLLIASSLLGLGEANAQEPPAAKPSKKASYAIGVVVPLSGEYAPLGEQVLEAAKIAASDVGVRLVSADTEGTPVGAIKAIQELAGDDSVLAVLGPLGRRESRAAAQIAQRVGVPLFALASAKSVNTVGSWVYRLRLTPAEQAAALADAARQNFADQERAAVFFPESKYGSEAALAFARQFEAAGGQVVAVASYPENTTDFRKPLDELVGRRVQLGQRARVGKRRADGDGYLKVRRESTVDFDVLFVPDFHTRVARMLPFFPAAGIQTGEGGEGVAVQMLGLSGWQGSSMKLTGAHAAGAVYSDLYAGSTDGGRAEEFGRMFEGKTGRRPVNLDAEVFDATWMLAKLVEKSAGYAAKMDDLPSASALRLHLARHLPGDAEFKGVTGEFGFGEQGKPLSAIRLYEFDVQGAVTPWR